jgi:hypothetical protein
MDTKQAAQVMGMKLREIVDVRRVPGGHAVTTHDGVVTLVTKEGELLPYTAVAPAEERQGPAPTPSTAPGPAAPAPTPDGDVPEGTEKDVLGWVGDDRDRAALALAAENAKESPRKGLVDKLGKLAG